MITDRTQSDVDLAKTLRLKVQAKFALTSAEKAQLERGACTITMLNRVNSKTGELISRLNNLAYRVAPAVVMQEKAYSDILSREEYDSIFTNLNKLKTAFYTYSTTPQTPIYLYGYEEANDVERILVDIENMLNDMTDRFRICGNTECGE